MTIDLNKIPEEIPAIWVLALALIAMNTDADSHLPILRVNITGDGYGAERLACSLVRNGYLIPKEPRDFMRLSYILTPEGHRLLDRIEVGCPIG